MPGRPAVFLDRDGTLIEERHYLADPAGVVLLPGAAAAVRRANAAGAAVVVVTNQSGVARGLFPEDRVAVVHARLAELLAAESARVDAFYHCPHHPTDGVGVYRVDCDCRKPKPGMLLAAARDLGLDLSASCMVGDKPDDVLAGLAAGGRMAVLVRTGYGADAELPPGGHAAKDVADAVEMWAAGT